MDSEGYFTISDLLEYEKAKKVAMLYLINMLNIYCSNKSIDWMMEDRLKTIESINKKIAKKMQEKGTDFDPKLDLMDIAGLRIIFCDSENLVPRVESLDEDIHLWDEKKYELKFEEAKTKDDNYDIMSIYGFLDFLVQNNSDNRIALIKDYIDYTKPSGYQGLHIIMEIPDSRQECKGEFIPVEIQLRNYIQHLYNEKEHDVRYKKKGKYDGRYSVVFKKCSNFLNEVADDTLERLRSSKKFMLVR